MVNVILRKCSQEGFVPRKPVYLRASGGQTGQLAQTLDQINQNAQEVINFFIRIIAAQRQPEAPTGGLGRLAQRQENVGRLQ